MRKLILFLFILLLAGCEPRALIQAPVTTRHEDGSTAAGQWVEISRMPTARSEMPVAVVDGKFYVPGGFLGLTTVEVYDPATNDWDALASLPQGRHHAMAAGHNGKVYVFGGAQETSWLPTNTTWIYDPVADSWAEKSPMPETRMSGAALALGDFLYVTGGAGGTEALLRYDPSADRWDRLATLPHHREHLAAVVFEDELWAIGGRQEANTLASIDIYDPDTDTWRDGPAMIEARSGHGAAVVDGKIIAVGGEVLDRQPWQVLATAEIYDPAAGWSTLPDLPSGLHGLPVATANGTIYTLGGSDRAGAIENQGRVLIYGLGDR
jgi:N-acetylneuraminic acid mutarotase